MDEQRTPAADESGAAARKPAGWLAKDRLAKFGFILVLAGPALLILAGLVSGGRLPRVAGLAVMWVALILPAVGFVCGVISLFRWKRNGKTARALAIVTVVMCNPLFYYIYFAFGTIAGYTLAGISWM